MIACSFCSRPAQMQAGHLYLCSACRAQLLSLPPEHPAYLWYARAVRRALFGAAGLSSAMSFP